MLKKFVQQGRRERRRDAYSVPYVEPLSDARTPLADFFSILLDHMCVLYPTPTTSTMSDLDIPHVPSTVSLMAPVWLQVFPLQVIHPQWIYVGSSDASCPPLHLPNHWKIRNLCVGVWVDGAFEATHLPAPHLFVALISCPAQREFHQVAC